MYHKINYVCLEDTEVIVVFQPLVLQAQLKQPKSPTVKQNSWTVSAVFKKYIDL